MFKVGQKVVFIIHEGFDPHDACISPSNNEICTIHFYSKHKDMYQLSEYMRDRDGDPQGFKGHCLRPIDHSFGENLASEIEQEINEEQLVIK